MAFARTVMLALLFSIPSPACAAFYSLTYTEFAKGLWRSFADVSHARGLSQEQAATAEQIATLWIHVGPCMGNVEAPGIENPAGAHGVVMRAEPSSPLGAAILEMIAIMMRESLGRKPSSDMCKFALESAQRELIATPRPK